MAGIYISNDAQSWYESGPTRDVTIRGNKIYRENPDDTVTLGGDAVNVGEDGTVKALNAGTATVTVASVAVPSMMAAGCALTGRKRRES